jgi:hypothetical protein
MAGTAASGAAAVAQAIKASGAIVRLDEREFQRLVNRMDSPLVVRNQGGLGKRTFQYLTGYRGLVFHTKTQQRIHFPSGTEIIEARKIWIP